MASSKWRLFFWIGALSALFALGFFVKGLLDFATVCRHYAHEIAKKEVVLPKNVGAREAIVVLTGDRKRIPKALELLRLRGSPLLIISGAAKGVTLKELVNQQGDSVVNIHEIWTKILLESRSSSTIENAVESGKLLLKRRMKRIILVTSEYHMRRAGMIFHQALPHMEIIEYPVASDFSHIKLSLSEKTLTGVWYFWLEYWKTLLYRFYSSRYMVPLD